MNVSPPRLFSQESQNLPEAFSPAARTDSATGGVAGLATLGRETAHGLEISVGTACQEGGPRTDAALVS